MKANHHPTRYWLSAEMPIASVPELRKTQAAESESKLSL